MIFDLPTSLDVSGKSWAINSDFRDVLRTLTAFEDPDVTDEEKAYICLHNTYPDLHDMPRGDLQAAFDAAVAFIDHGSGDSGRPSPRTMDWTQDANLIFPAVNRVAGFEVRGVDYMHWWTFMGYFMEIRNTTYTSGGTPDLEYATIDMDDASVTISVTPSSGAVNGTWIQLTPGAIRFVLGTGYEFDLSPGTSSHPLSIGNGGTGATTPAGACANLASGIPTAAYTLIPNSDYGPNVSAGSDPLKCIKYGNGLKRLVGLISITGDVSQAPRTLCTVPTGFEHVNNNNGGSQGWGTITKSSGGESYLFRFSGNRQ